MHVQFTRFIGGTRCFDFCVYFSTGKYYLCSNGTQVLLAMKRFSACTMTNIARKDRWLFALAVHDKRSITSAQGKTIQAKLKSHLVTAAQAGTQHVMPFR